MIKTIEYSAGVTAVDFSKARSYGASNRYYAVRNYGDSDIFMSASDTCKEGVDGSKRVPAGECRGIDMEGHNVLYINAQGAGTAEIDTAAGISALGFNGGSKGGGSSGGVVTASGNPVQLDGLQGGVPFNTVEVSGKNLITYPYYDGESKTMNGVTFIVNSDGSVTANGTATADSVFYFIKEYKFLIKNTNLFLSGCPNNGSGITYDIVIAGLDIERNVVYANNDVGKGQKISLPSNAETVNVYIRIRSGQIVDNLVFRPQLELGDTATEYTPPITGRDLTVGVSGKNLLQKMLNKTIGGLNYTTNDDGSVNVTGTQTAENYPNITSVGGMLLKAGKYTLSGGTERLQITALDVGTNTIIARSKIAPATISIDTDKYVRIYVYSTGAYNGQTFDDVIYPQLELGDTATAYEPYHGAEYTITPDSNPYTVPVDITQYDGINVLSNSDDSNPTISVNANKASEQLGTIYRTLNNKPVLLFDGTIPTSSGSYAEFSIDKEYTALIIVPTCNTSSLYSPGVCTVIPMSYIGTEEKEFSVIGYPRGSQTSSRAYIKRDGNTIYVRESSTSCDYMTIYGI